MTKEERKEKAELHKKLIDLLVDTPTDATFFRRLVWANQIIANALSNFESITEGYDEE